MDNTQPLISYPNSKNRLLIIDWASISYQIMWGAVKPNIYNYQSKFVIDSQEKEMLTFRTGMASMLCKIVKLFNPKDVIIALEGTGTIWRKTEYAEYYKKNTKIAYDETGYYVSFDNYKYKVSKDATNQIVVDDIDLSTELPTKTISFDNLKDPVKSIIKDLIPEYKGQRKDKEWPFISTKKEWGVYRDAFARDIATLFRAKCPMDSECEGDDIIHISIVQNVEKYDSIILATEDTDFNQELHYKNVQIYNHRKESMAECFDAKYYLDVKVLSGDKSDNINGIALPGKKKQLGEGNAKKLMESTGGNVIAKAEAEGWKDQYMRNRKLIDMTFIPTEIFTRVKNMIDDLKPELKGFDAIYSLGITEKIASEMASMQSMGYYSMRPVEEMDKNPNLFLKHEAVQRTETFNPTIGFGNFTSGF